MDVETLYYLYKPDFISAYNNNGNNVEMAITQVALLRQVDADKVKQALKPLINKLTSKRA